MSDTGKIRHTQRACVIGRTLWASTFLLLPVLAFGQIKDQSINLKNLPAANDPGAVGWILAHISETNNTSSMPRLTGRAAAPSGLKVQYHIENNYPRRKGLDDRRYPKDGFVTIPGSDYWKMHETWDKDFSANLQWPLGIGNGWKRTIQRNMQLVRRRVSSLKV